MGCGGRGTEGEGQCPAREMAADEAAHLKMAWFVTVLRSRILLSRRTSWFTTANSVPCTKFPCALSTDKRSFLMRQEEHTEWCFHRQLVAPDTTHWFDNINSQFWRWFYFPFLSE